MRKRNPAQLVNLLKENHERNRLLSPNEYIRRLAACSEPLQPIIKVAYCNKFSLDCNNQMSQLFNNQKYFNLKLETRNRKRYYTGMRQGEILNLTWGQVDIKKGFITLRPEDTKTNEGRLIPLALELVEMFKAMPRGLPSVRVFQYKGKAFGSTFQKAFNTAKKQASIEDFTFHDLRHTAINNFRLAGHDFFRIMAVSGHKTMTIFKRYNTVSEEELKALVGEKI